MCIYHCISLNTPFSLLKQLFYISKWCRVLERCLGYPLNNKLLFTPWVSSSENQHWDVYLHYSQVYSQFFISSRPLNWKYLVNFALFNILWKLNYLGMFRAQMESLRFAWQGHWLIFKGYILKIMFVASWWRNFHVKKHRSVVLIKPPLLWRSKEIMCLRAQWKPASAVGI